jgi:hypothetical protein
MHSPSSLYGTSANIARAPVGSCCAWSDLIAGPGLSGATGLDDEENT